MTRAGVVLVLLLLRTVVGAQTTTGATPAGLYYEVSGSGDERRFRVSRYDLRGHGNSAAPSEPYAPHDDLRSVLDTLDAAKLWAATPIMAVHRDAAAAATVKRSS